MEKNLGYVVICFQISIFEPLKTTPKLKVASVYLL